MVLDSATPLQFPRNMVLIENMSKTLSKTDAKEETNEASDVNEFLPNNSQTAIEEFRSSSSFRSSAFGINVFMLSQQKGEFS